MMTKFFLFSAISFNVIRSAAKETTAFARLAFVELLSFLGFLKSTFEAVFSAFGLLFSVGVMKTIFA